MVCKKLIGHQGIKIHPFGLLLIILGCTITVFVHNMALMKAAEENKNGDETGNNKEGDGEGEEDAGESEGGEGEGEGDENAEGEEAGGDEEDVGEEEEGEEEG